MRLQFKKCNYTQQECVNEWLHEFSHPHLINTQQTLNSSVSHLNFCLSKKAEYLGCVHNGTIPLIVFPFGRWQACVLLSAHSVADFFNGALIVKSTLFKVDSANIFLNSRRAEKEICLPSAKCRNWWTPKKD